VRSNLIKQQDGQITGRQRMSPESLQTIILAVVAILPLFQLTVLVGIAPLLVRIRKNTVRPSFLNFKSFEDATDRLPVKTETDSKPFLP
jgi:hypothetical protein